jgi:Rod binding domain-containing protein
MSLSPIAAAPPPVTLAERDAELRKTFQHAVAGVLFAQMLKALRASVGKPAYLHGGQAEEMFQSQFDQHLAEQLAQTKGSPFVEDLYRQFRIQLGFSPEDASPDAEQPASPVQSAPADRLAELTESARQARLDAERTAGTTGTAALSAMFRK